MCEPVSATTAAVLIAGTVISAGAAAYGAYATQKAQNDAAEYNASVAEAEAKYAVEQGKIDAAQKRKEVRRLIGAQRAAYGASGAVVDSGSPLDVTVDTATLGEYDALNIKQNAKNQAWKLNADAGLSRMSKSSALLAGGTSLLTSAAGAASSYGSMRSSYEMSRPRAAY